MKINRVILASDPNPLYCDFWNPLSKVYAEKFGIKPTLAWIGTPEEARENKISTKYGDIIYVQKNDRYQTPWQCTWAVFWASQFYPDDTILTIGIDQVPLSRLFFDMVNNLPDQDYAMLIADAYRPHCWTTTASPTAYHIAKGSTMQRIYQFEPVFSDEVEKLGTCGLNGFWENTEGRWGIDETYSSMKLRQTNVTIHSMDNFRLLCERRIECERWKEPVYDTLKLAHGWYSEAHLCRPFRAHSEYITNLFNAIATWE